MKKVTLSAVLALAVLNLAPVSASAADCRGLPTWKEVKTALTKARTDGNGGLNLDMWGTVVNRDGQVCSVVFTGNARGEQWPGSRVISAQKAFTANAFSLPKLSLSTANLYSAVQPGGSLYGLQFSNPVDPSQAYSGEGKSYGLQNDPMVGKRVGGVNVFGGGLALYNNRGEIVGAIGVSGDTSCADHNIAWRARKELKLDFVPAGVSPSSDDNVMYLAKGEGANGYKHPTCGGKENEIQLPAISKAVKTAQQ